MYLILRGESALILTLVSYLRDKGDSCSLRATSSQR